jgi:putative two-component system response regulator
VTDFAGSMILVVDDEHATRNLMMRMLAAAGYRCAEAETARSALALIAHQTPQLVITDVTMPGASGIALVNALRPLHPAVSAMVVTGRDDTETARAALEAGAFGYIIKPFQERELLIAVEGALQRRTLELEDRDHRRQLEEVVRQQTRELDESRAETVEHLARAVESRDPDTRGHVDRMSELAFRLACALGWEEDNAETLRLASVVHDVGKVGIPDEILLKRGRLDPEERAVVERHAAIGHAILSGGKSELLNLADAIAWTHHERIDGTGYPRGLVGEEISLAGRIAAVADVFDALTSERPYRGALSEIEALAVIRADAGLDPAVVAALEGLCALESLIAVDRETGAEVVEPEAAGARV